MDKLDDLFNLGDENFSAELEVKSMTQTEFDQKTKKLLGDIAAKYAASWVNKDLDYDEMERQNVEPPCGSCTHDGCFMLNGRRVTCVRGNGECYERYFDGEEFGNYMEDKMFNEVDFFHLLQCKIEG